MESVFKIKAYGPDDFVVFYKRKSNKKEVAYLLTQSGIELTSDAVTEKVSDLRYDKDVIWRTDVRLHSRNTFFVTRID